MCAGSVVLNYTLTSVITGLVPAALERGLQKRKSKTMAKSSYDYAELSGLKAALSHANFTNADKIVIEWLKNRIKELESK